MKRFVTASILAMMVSSVAMADVAQAQPRHEQRYDDRRDNRDRYDRYDSRDRYDRRDDRRDYRENRRYYRDGHRDGWRDRSDYRRGGYVGYRDWDRGRYVEYRGHRGLYAPPRGYEWRQVDDRYVLAAVATGLIAAIVLSH